MGDSNGVQLIVPYVVLVLSTANNLVGYYIILIEGIVVLTGCIASGRGLEGVEEHGLKMLA
jgi:hypothetical protein